MCDIMVLKLLAILSLLATPAFADIFGSGANTFTMNFVTIGNAENANDDTGYGDVGYDYRMGVNEVSRGMIDTYNSLSSPDLTMSDMTSYGGNGVNRPATGISWNEAARFVNWLNISNSFSPAYKFTTDGYNDDIALWESGDAGYNAANPFRNANAHYYLPSEDEWYKAAYYDPNKSGGAGYYDYATGSDSAPTEVAGGMTSGTAVYNGQVGPADITNAGGLSAYGTMAQNGNVWEWGESIFTAQNVSAVDSRVLRSGFWNDGFGILAASHRYEIGPKLEYYDVGFRVAAVPEPSAIILSLLGMMGFVMRRRR